jgi:hypothetical protein
MTAPPAREDDAPDLVWRVTSTPDVKKARRDRAERDAAAARACSGWLSATSGK